MAPVPPGSSDRKKPQAIPGKNGNGSNMLVFRFCDELAVKGALSVQKWQVVESARTRLFPLTCQLTSLSLQFFTDKYVRLPDGSGSFLQEYPAPPQQQMTMPIVSCYLNHARSFVPVLEKNLPSTTHCRVVECLVYGQPLTQSKCCSPQSWRHKAWPTPGQFATHAEY